MQLNDEDAKKIAAELKKFMKRDLKLDI